MSLSWPPKSPGERLDYSLNWGAALGSDTITSSAWTLSDAGITTDSNSNTSRTTTIWLLGGTPNTQYTAINTIHTAAGRIFVQSATINVVSAT